MIVGTQGTVEGRNAPDPSVHGMHDGCWMIGLVRVCCQGAVWFASQPHPSVAGPRVAFGLSPVNPSSWAAARSIWPPQLGAEASWNVRSEIANCCARVDRFGSWVESYCS